MKKEYKVFHEKRGNRRIFKENDIWIPMSSVHHIQDTTQDQDSGFINKNNLLLVKLFL